MSATVRDKYMASVAIAAAVTFGAGIAVNPPSYADEVDEELNPIIEAAPVAEIEEFAELDPQFVTDVETAPVAVVNDVELDGEPDEVIDNGTSKTVIYSGNDSSTTLDDEGLDGLGDSEEIIIVDANVGTVSEPTIISGEDAVVTVSDDGLDGLGDSELIVVE